MHKKKTQNRKKQQKPNLDIAACKQSEYKFQKPPLLSPSIRMLCAKFRPSMFFLMPGLWLKAQCMKDWMNEWTNDWKKDWVSEWLLKVAAPMVVCLFVTRLWWWWRQTWQFYLVLTEFEMRRRLANKSCLEWAGCDNFNHNNINYWLEGAAEHDIKLIFAQNSMKTYNEGTVEKMPEIHRLRKLICSYIDLVQGALLYSMWSTPTHSRFIMGKHGPAILSRKSYAIWSIIWSIPSTIKSSVNWNRSTYLGGLNRTNAFTTKQNRDTCVNCYFLLRAGI